MKTLEETIDGMTALLLSGECIDLSDVVTSARQYLKEYQASKEALEIDRERFTEACLHHMEAKEKLEAQRIQMAMGAKDINVPAKKSDLIGREDAIEALDFEIVHMTAYCNGKSEGNLLAQYNKGLEDGIKAIRALPSAEPGAKKGKWIDTTWKHTYKCSECGNFLEFHGVNAGRGDANFCPNCGVDMRGDR